MTIQLEALPSPRALDIMEKSAETMKWLRENIRVGYTSQRGPAWWANGVVTKDGTWEGIPDGSHFEGPVPMKEVQKLLDFPLVKAENTNVVYLDENGERQVSVDTDTLPILNQRTGQVFCYPKKGYAIHPYWQTLAGFIGKILDDDSVGVGSVGLLKKGGVAFLQAVMPHGYEIRGYGFVPYIMAVTSADQTRSTSYSTGFKGAVCDNTVNMALSDALSMLKIRHTKNSGVTVQDARERLGIRLEMVADETQQAIEALLEVEVSEKQFTKYLDLSAPLRKEDGTMKNAQTLAIMEKKRGELTRLWTKDDKVAPWTGTAFGIIQADNTYRTWEGNVTKRSIGGRMEKNFTADALGGTADGDRKAMQLLAKVLDRELVLA